MEGERAYIAKYIIGAWHKCGGGQLLVQPPHMLPVTGVPHLHRAQA